MKIGILTLRLGGSYGGIMQAYALQQVLKQMGHEVEHLVNTQLWMHSLPLMPFVFAKRFLNKIFEPKSHTRILQELYNRKTNSVLERHAQAFINTHFSLRQVKGLPTLCPDDLDAIVVGSDQVWRSPYFRGDWFTHISDAFLGFTARWDIRRVAYAASFGTDNLDGYSASDTEMCAKSAKLFDAISVRERSGVDICRDRFGVDAVHVVDPTMLLSVTHYQELSANRPPHEGKLMVFLLDPTPEKQSIIQRLHQITGFKPYSVGLYSVDSDCVETAVVKPPVEDWLQGFQDAELVVTDSFHGTVFSIIYGKPFIAIANQNRGQSRFDSLLNLFGLTQRLINKEDELVKSLSTPIDNKRVQTILTQERERALSFLTSSLR